MSAILKVGFYQARVLNQYLTKVGREMLGRTSRSSRIKCSITKKAKARCYRSSHLFPLALRMASRSRQRDAPVPLADLSHAKKGQIGRGLSLGVSFSKSERSIFRWFLACLAGFIVPSTRFDVSGWVLGVPGR